MSLNYTVMSVNSLFIVRFMYDHCTFHVLDTLIMRPDRSGREKFTNGHLEIRLILHLSIHCMSVCQTEVLSEEIGEKQISSFCFKGDQNIPLMRITLC